LLSLIQNILAYLLLAITIFVGVVGGWAWVPLGLFMVCVLLSLSRILDTLETMKHHQLGLPLDRKAIQLMEIKATKYRIKSESLELTPEEEPEYKLLMLEQEAYIRLRLLSAYIQEQQEAAYTLQFPGEPPLQLSCESGYTRGADLFEHHHLVYAKLSALPVRWWTNEDELRIEHRPFHGKHES